MKLLQKNYPYVLLVIFTILLVWVAISSGEAITPPADLWKGIIAEAVSEGYVGMRGVCHVYKNRMKAGLPLGCVGLKRKDLDEFVERQGVKYERMAKNIIGEVFKNQGRDITNGATHYEHLEAFGKPYWADSMVITCKIKNHTFYREK